jgi:hypothetical protein
MRRFLRYFFCVILFFASYALGTLIAMASPDSEKMIGDYSLKQMKNLRFACQKNDIKSIKLISGRPSACKGEMRIQSVAVAYESGFQQFFDYPNDGMGRGSPLTTASFNILPRTKCLNAISANLTLKGETNTACLDKHRIRVLVSR